MLDSEVEAPAPHEAPSSPSSIPRRRRRGMLLGGTAVLAVGAAGALYATQSGESSTPAKSASSLPTVSVVRTDMVNTRDVDGTLGYSGNYSVLAAGSGRITWLPAAGDVIAQGKRVYGVNGRDVPLLYGTTPFWRDLKQGMTNGRDVLELEQNLDKLGYGSGITVDRSFTAATAEAVKDWQEDRGVTRTGVVGLDSVIVQPGPIRVTELKAVPGAPAGGVLLTATGTERVVTVQLAVSDQKLAKKGAEVQVTLPGGKKAKGRIASVGTVATAESTNSKSQTGEGTQNATVPVYITLDKASGAGDLEHAPVTAGFSSAVHKNVLAVPINALLASSDSSYSVNVVNAAGTVRSVPVELGIFAGDKVEVSGSLTAGAKVQVPQS
ncbi:peptidoglycan-binding protein [Streptomyces phaeochromogenes]|uniref:peptidoglycan-binding protein n=1 Tax=Streptomyces phaeochromogenes TaxID=1923 RepID=UPI00340D7052